MGVLREWKNPFPYGFLKNSDALSQRGVPQQKGQGEGNPLQRGIIQGNVNYNP